MTAFEELGFVEGGKEVATEQGEMCTPFLKDYAKANAVKMLAVRATTFHRAQPYYAAESCVWSGRLLCRIVM